MTNPVRYSEVSNDWNGEAAGLAPSSDGEWIKHQDYLIILDELTKLKSELEKRTELGETLYLDLSLFAKEKFGHCDRYSMRDWRRAVTNKDDLRISKKFLEAQDG